jgi:hypothetical protein
MMVTFGCALLAAVGLSVTPASAGGWAVSTVDALPVPRAGMPVDVGFTIRQHGVRPVNVDDVGIELREGNGRTTFLPAEQQGAVGHYVARVVFPTDGGYRWAIRQGWFGAYDLGAIDVGRREAVAGAGASGGHRWSAPTRAGLLALAGLLTAVTIGDLVAARRRRRRDLAPA